MSVYKNKPFTRFAQKERITDQDLCKAAAEIENGEYDADLGAGVFKQRVARTGGGRSGSFRTIVLFKTGSHMFFVHGYPKSSRANIKPNEREGFRKLADVFLAYTEQELAVAVSSGKLIEVLCDEDEAQGAEEASD